MADIYTSTRLFVGQLTAAGEFPDDEFTKTYRRLAEHIINRMLSDYTSPRRFPYNYCKREDGTPDNYWKGFKVCQAELKEAVASNGLELWWYVFSEGIDSRLWEEVKGDFLRAVNGQVAL